MDVFDRIIEPFRFPLVATPEGEDFDPAAQGLCVASAIVELLAQQYGDNVESSARVLGLALTAIVGAKEARIIVTGD